MNHNEAIQNRSRALTGRGVRSNRYIEKLSNGPMVLKVPHDMGVDEDNVCFGLGSSGAVAIAAGASFTFSVPAPRDLIMRRLTVQNLALATDTAFLVNAVSIEGRALVQGLGAPGGMFVPGQFDKPNFDIPCAGGTPITVTVTNTSAVGVVYGAAFTID